MEDRLIEFHRISGVHSVVAIPPPQPGEDAGDFLPQFSKRTKLLQQALNQVRYNNQEILKQKDKHKEATTNENEKKISDEITRLIDQNNVLSKTVADQLSAMKDDVEQSKKDDPSEPETKMKIVSHQSLSNKFSAILKESQAVQLEYKSAVKDKLARQAKIYDNSLSNEQLEEIVNDPEGMDKLISQKMIGGTNSRVQNAVSDMQEKYKDILKLEQSVQVMHQMFQDMALLVHANGELINSIELNINDARDYVKKANVRLADGMEDHKKAKKMQWMMMLCCLIVVGVLLVIKFVF
jgi:syntaxin 1B/2/3